jgi:hypothetical protein
MGIQSQWTWNTKWSLYSVEGWNSQNGLGEMKVVLDDVVHADGKIARRPDDFYLMFGWPGR